MSALSDPPTMAFLCRADLQLSSGKLAVQCAHAAVGSLKQAKKTHSRMVQRWSETASRKVCLAVEDEDELTTPQKIEELEDGSRLEMWTLRRDRFDSQNNLISRFVLTTVGRVVMNYTIIDSVSKT